MPVAKCANGRIQVKLRMHNIYIVRHGESEANANPNLYYEKHGHNLVLTEEGKAQSRACGGKLAHIVGDTPYATFVSSYARARETWDEIAKARWYSTPTPLVIDGRLREQEHKDFKDYQEYKAKKAEADERSAFYYRWKNGESTLDVVNRVAGFYNQLRMDLLLKNLPPNIVVVSHEVAIRCLLLVIFGWKPEQHEFHVPHCEVMHLTAGENLQFKYEPSEEEPPPWAKKS